MPDLTPLPQAPQAAPAPAPAAPQRGPRPFGDPDALRTHVFDAVLEAAGSAPDVVNKTHTLRLRDVRYVDPDRVSKADHKKALLEGKTLGRRMRGTWELLDNATGAVVDSRTQVVAKVPYATHMGAFVHNGSDYTVNHQQRLKPGIYTRVKQNGEVSSHVNVLPGKGFSHHYILDPSRGTFHLEVGQARVPLMPLLKALGATDDQLREAWGRDLYAANYGLDSEAALRKLAAKAAKPHELEGKTPSEVVAAKFLGMAQDPEVNRRTLGKPYDRLSADAVLDATKKLLSVFRGEAEPDDRDHMAYQRVVGPEDLFAERVTLDHGRLRRSLLARASLKGNLSSLSPGALTPQLEQAILGSGLGQSTEEVNPGEVFDKQTSVTRMGEGGLPSADVIPDESRAVHPSHLGFIDPIRTPECYDGETEVMTRKGWVKWPVVVTQPETEFAVLLDGKLTWSKADALHVFDYDGEMYGVSSDTLEYLVTKDHRLWTRPYDGDRSGAYRFVSADLAYGRVRGFMCGGFEPYEGMNYSATTFRLPPVDRGSNSQKEYAEIPLEPWCEFLGWYLAEGCFAYDPEQPTYTTLISQSLDASPENYARIGSLLSDLPFSWSMDPKGFRLSGKQLAHYVRQFGFCSDKFIPEEYFEFPVAARRRLLEALLLGDGRRDRSQRRTQFSSTSRRLSEDVQRLAFGLGISSTIAVEPDNREPHFLDNHVVHLHIRNERVANRRNHFKAHFVGKVYCATVPGGLLYVRRSDKSGHWSGNSSRVGVDVFFAGGAQKRSDGTVAAPFRDVRTGQVVHMSPVEIADHAVAFPGSLAEPGRRVKAMKGGRITYVPREEVAYEVPHFERAFSPTANLVPLKSMAKGQRVAMGSRMITQALPLVNGEAPLVRAADPETGKSYEEAYGRHFGAELASHHGVVKSVAPDRVVVRTDDGKDVEHELYVNHPFNRKTFAHQTPVVRPGDRVAPGALLARSNYTDEKGHAAVGMNARVAFVPWGGLNFEDAIVISDSFAKKFTSEHMYQHELPKDDRTTVGKKQYLSMFPGRHEPRHVSALGDDGVVKVGTVVEKGQPLVVGYRERDRAVNRVHKPGQAGYSDASLTWDHDDPGVVTDVAQGRDGPVVVVKALSRMQVGDKMSGRHGNKGVVSRIIPDHQMPHDRDGRPFEVLMNPLGVISRLNPATVAETVLGKAAEKRGEPYAVPDFSGEADMSAWVERELQKHGVDEFEPVVDPVSGRMINPGHYEKGPDGKLRKTGSGVLTGRQFFMKLHHMAEHKGQARDSGAYTQDETPAKGGPSGSKRVSLIDTNALLAHGATQVMRDAALVRGQKNDDYYLRFVQGHNPPDPGVPFVYRKFVDSLKASGVNVVRHGHQTHVMALTNKDVDALAGDREVTSGDTVHFDKDLKPVDGGLFDTKLTGGHGGSRWAAVRLHEPMLNPVMEEPARRLLGLTQKQLEGVISGSHHLPTGTGPEALRKALSSINVTRELALERARFKNSTGSKRDDSARRLGYLKSLQATEMNPGDWVLDRAPVLPPSFRPVSLMGSSGVPLVADPNWLYKDLIEANDNLGASKKELGDGNVADERLAVYNALKAVTGLGDPVSVKNQERKVKGILRGVFGSSPKLGAVQRKLISSTVDQVGRAVITPNPAMDMDHVGLPEDLAFEVYSKFVARRLVRKGMKTSEALREVKDRTPRARRELVSEMEERPVIVNRAPVLHKFGIMAHKPVLVAGHTLHLSPLVVKGYGADFDGDAVQFHVPVDDRAREEALERMLPSKSLLSVSDFKTPMHMPGQEYVAGLYEATKPPQSDAPPRVFRTRAEVRQAYHAGKLRSDEPVLVLE